MVRVACFSFLVHHTLHPRPGPSPEPGLAPQCLLGQSPACSELCVVLQAVPWGIVPLEYEQEGVGQREIHFSGHIWSTEAAVNHFPELCCVSQGHLTNAALPEICRIRAYVFFVQVFSPSSLGSYTERVHSAFSNAVTLCTGCPFFPASTIFHNKVSDQFSHEQFVLLHSADLVLLYPKRCLSPSL